MDLIMIKGWCHLFYCSE